MVASGSYWCSAGANAQPRVNLAKAVAWPVTWAESLTTACSAGADARPDGRTTQGRSGSSAGANAHQNDNHSRCVRTGQGERCGVYGPKAESTSSVSPNCQSGRQLRHQVPSPSPIRHFKAFVGFARFGAVAGDESCDSRLAPGVACVAPDEPSRQSVDLLLVFASPGGFWSSLIWGFSSSLTDHHHRVRALESYQSLYRPVPPFSDDARACPPIVVDLD